MVSAAVLAACASESPRTAADSQAAHVAAVAAAGGTVDSILPIAEQLRRFRESLPAPDSLRHGAMSRDGLIRQFLEAVAAKDSATLNQLVLDRAEFAYLYYPTAAISKPPYEAPPQLLWGQILTASNEGISRLLTRVNGQRLALDSVTCGQPVTVEDRNTLYEKCEIRVRIGTAAPSTERWFGTIVERDGRFKFIGYTNAL
ncbi:hypothetical protein MASR1M101_39450 [Gemmatimonas sp.]